MPPRPGEGQGWLLGVPRGSGDWPGLLQAEGSEQGLGAAPGRFPVRVHAHNTAHLNDTYSDTSADARVTSVPPLMALSRIRGTPERPTPDATSLNKCLPLKTMPQMAFGFCRSEVG